MTEQNKIPKPTEKAVTPPPSDDILKQAQRQKAEAKEVAGRHKNDGQKGHKGSR